MDPAYQHVMVEWIAQAMAIVVLALIRVISRQWFAAAGVLVGGAVGFSPLFLLRGPAVWAVLSIIALVSTIALALVFAAIGRWVVLLLVCLISILPLTYHWFVFEPFPPSSNLLAKQLVVMSQLASLLAPLWCAFAGMELLGRLDRVRSA
jgi:hypothetical protein